MSTLKDKLLEFVQDITTLDVVTYSGELKLTPGDIGDTVTPESILNALKGKIKEDSVLELVASTRIDIDSDVLQFISSNTSPHFANLVEQHAETVRASQEARRQMAAMIANAVGLDAPLSS